LLDALAHLTDGPAGPDERRRPITSDARELRRSAQRALDLQHQCGDMRRRFQQLARPGADHPSQSATARARTMDRSSCSKRSRTDAGPDATDKALMTDWRSAEAPRRRSAPRPCALLAAAGTYSTSSIAFPSLLDLSARRRHSKGNAKAARGGKMRLSDVQLGATEVGTRGHNRLRTAITRESRPRFSEVGFGLPRLCEASGACGRKVVEVQILSSAPLS